MTSMNGIRKKYKIIVVEPSVIIAEGLKALLSAQPEFELTHCFTELQPFLERASLLHADILVLNPAVIDRPKRMNHRTLFASQPNLVVLALLYGYTEQETLKQYNGVIEITDEASAILRKLRLALENNRDTPDSNESYELSERETEILTAVARGLTNKEIADLHHISIHTVISHRKNITRKTGIKTVSGLTVYAFLNNLIDQNEVE